MARSPLFRRLQQLSQRVTTEQTGQDARSRSPLSRRGFCKISSGAAAVAGLSTSACAGSLRASSRSPSNLRVAIIGAGMAGLHCAYRLKEAGIQAHVYESSERVGGRIFSTKHRRADDLVLELGGELIDSDHLAMHSLAKEFEIALDDLKADPARASEVWWVDDRPVDEDVLLQQFGQIAATLAQQVDAADHDDVRFDELDRMSLRKWLDQYTPKSQFPELYAMLESAYRGEFGMEVDYQSALNLVYLLGSGANERFEVFGASDERYHCHDGNEALIQALAGQLPAQIFLEHTLVAAHSLEKSQIRLEIATSNATIGATYDHVIFAIPFTKLRQLDLTSLEMSAQKRRIIETLGYGMSSKTMGLWSERAWETHYHSSGSITSTEPFQQVWATSRGQPGKVGVLTNFLGGQQSLEAANWQPETWYATFVVAAVDKVFPGLRDHYLDDTAIRMHWPTHRHTLASYSCYLPGQWATAGLEGARAGNLHFCGEHTSVYYQGYMEGAAETGAFVASEILSQYDLEPSQALAALLLAKRSGK